MAESNSNPVEQGASTQKFACPQDPCNHKFDETYRLKWVVVDQPSILVLVLIKVRAHIKSVHAYGRTFCNRCYNKFKKPRDLVNHQRQDKPCPVVDKQAGEITAMQVGELESIKKGIGEEATYCEILRILSIKQSSGMWNNPISLQFAFLPPFFELKWSKANY